MFEFARGLVRFICVQSYSEVIREFLLRSGLAERFWDE